MIFHTEVLLTPLDLGDAINQLHSQMSNHKSADSIIHSEQKGTTVTNATQRNLPTKDQSINHILLFKNQKTKTKVLLLVQILIVIQPQPSNIS